MKDITSFIERNAGIWGARRDVTNRLEYAVQQSVEAAVEFANVSGPIKVEISFDEFVIDALISYIGLPLQFPETGALAGRDCWRRRTARCGSAAS